MDEMAMPRCVGATRVGLSIVIIRALAQAEERQDGEHDDHESNQIDQAVHETLQSLFATTNSCWPAKFLRGANFARSYCCVHRSGVSRAISEIIALKKENAAPWQGPHHRTPYLVSDQCRS
jgi:hypothetical protein